MANRNTQFASNTLKYESDSYVKGSNGLYIFQFATGTNRDLRQELVDYHYRKAGIPIAEETQKRTLSEIFWGVFKKPDDQTYEDFVEDVKNGRVGFIGNSPILPIGRDYTRVDANGNLLVATINSNLDEYTDGCGNMLISGETGEVIRAPKPTVIINPVDKVTGFYPIEVYKTWENRENGNREVYDREYNFLDMDGKILCNEQNFTVDEDNNPIIDIVARNFYMRDGKKVYSSWDVISPAYVHSTWKGSTLYPHVIDLILENRERIRNGEDPIVKNEDFYIRKLYIRKHELDDIIQRIGEAYDEGQITEDIYKKIMEYMDAEFSLMEYFENNIETQRDMEIEEELFSEMQIERD